jgi:hypothetical protein
MSTTADLMGLGFPPALAGRLGNTPQSISGNGTSQTGATKISGGGLFLITPTSSNTAFVLDGTLSTGRPVYLWNQSASQTALIFPPTGGKINGGSTNASVSIGTNAGAILQLLNGSGTSSEIWGANLTSSSSTNPTFASVTVTGAETVGTTFGVTGVTTPTGGVAGATATGATAAAVPTSYFSGQVGIVSATGQHNTTATNTTFYLCEIFIPVNCTITGLSLLNGTAAAAGNIQLALYSGDGSILAANTASTAMSGTSVYQQVAFTPGTYAAVGPAKYYVMATFSSSSASFETHTLGNFTTGTLTSQTYGTLPASITPPTSFTTNVGPVISTY